MRPWLVVSGVRWSCQAENSLAYIIARAHTHTRSHTHTHHHLLWPLGDRAFITHPSPSARVIGLLCPVQDEERDIHHCAHHCCHTSSPRTRMHTVTTKAHTSGRLQESHLSTLHTNSLNNNGLPGHRDYLRGDSHQCARMRVGDMRVAPVLITAVPVRGSEYTWMSAKPPRYFLMEVMCRGCMLKGFSRLFKEHRNSTAALPHISHFMQPNAHVTSCYYLSVFVERFAGSRVTGSLLG